MHTAVSNSSARNVQAMVASGQTMMAPKAGTGEPSADELFQMSEYFLHNGGFFGRLTPEAEAMISEAEFVFRGPLVGPLTKSSYIASLKMLDVKAPFPDLTPNPWGFCQDPENPLQVWFFVRETGTMTQDWKIMDALPAFKATNKPVRAAPSAYSMIWTCDRKLKYLSIGYVADRINSATPNGSLVSGSAAGALMTAADAGLLKAATIAAGPLTGIARTVVQFLGGAEDKDLGGVAWDDLPEWFKQLPNSKLKFGEGFDK